jgi:hypothetical protein
LHNTPKPPRAFPVSLAGEGRGNQTNPMQTVIDHIRTATPKSRLNRRRRSDRTGDIVTALAAFVGIAGILTISYIITHK